MRFAIQVHPGYPVPQNGLLRTRLNVRIFAFLFFLSVSAVLAQAPDDLVYAGDQLAADFKFPEALAQYERAYKADTSNCTALWKIAETHINLGEEADKILQKQHYYSAEKWARKAVTLCPEEPNAHFFLAVSSGLIALFEGGKMKINRSKVIQSEAEKTVALDPKHDGAYHVLGRWHREVANLSWFLKAAAKVIYGGVPPGASNEAAVANFRQAIDIRPNWINHHLQLGLTYMKIKKWAEALDSFEAALKLPNIDHQDQEHKEKAKKLLGKVNRELDK